MGVCPLLKCGVLFEGLALGIAACVFVFGHVAFFVLGSEGEECLRKFSSASSMESSSSVVFAPIFSFPKLYVIVLCVLKALETS